ncbi:hypothetical protein ABBQ32_000718 [Trebouxia sp. C0010 RCD-2024]
MSKGYLVPVTVKVCADGSKGHGVFATAPVTKGTLLWRPSEVKAVPAAKVTSSLAAMPREEASELLRQSFVAPIDPGALCINRSDNGRFTNHSSAPNVGACVDHSADSYALRDIAEGEELTCDYTEFVTPAWYQQLCHKYGVLTTTAVVELAAKQS